MLKYKIPQIVTLIRFRLNPRSQYLLLLLYGEVCRLIFVDNGSDVFSNRLRILTIFIYKILVAVVWLTLMWICLTGMLKLKKLVMRMGLYLVWISNLSKAVTVRMFLIRRKIGLN